MALSKTTVLEFKGKYLDELPLKLRPNNYSAILAAVKSYSPQIGSVCSFVFISNEGHALSSKHCFDEIFKNRNLVENQKIGDLEIGKYKKELIKKQVFPISIVDSDQSFNVEILAVGEGLEVIPSFIDLTTEQIKTLRSNNIGMFSDYVLFKIPIKNSPCVKIKEIQTQESVFSIGIQNKTQHKAEYKRTFAAGKICNELNMDDHIREMGTLSKLFFENTMKNMADKFNKVIRQLQPEILFHSAIMTSGASGGGLFNLEGYLVGINSFILLNSGDEKKYIPGAYASLSITKIKQLIASDMSEEQINAAFRCE